MTLSPSNWACHPKNFEFPDCSCDSVVFQLEPSIQKISSSQIAVLALSPSNWACKEKKSSSQIAVVVLSPFRIFFSKAEIHGKLPDSHQGTSENHGKFRILAWKLQKIRETMVNPTVARPRLHRTAFERALTVKSGKETTATMVKHSGNWSQDFRGDGYFSSHVRHTHLRNK